ncbi:hypothetical protein [Photobacterium sp. OFAV2-7]|uniref:hypothetical protein n=1 Tax=Photobacterium sp. OFAV2-7 TaxID=2917748 RepID=UPI001EF68A5A|nr:hypothetical protein [Photobacterium sp. OFAV2-7]MCG7586764.1 hypothetical protein [Photobacterium sp. OFAV2-7]
MDRPSFLVFSFLGSISMVILHLIDIWLLEYSDSLLRHFLVEWLPLYLVWMSMMLIGLVKRTSPPTHG